MPILLDPKNQRVDYALMSDRQKPEATRPTFIVKALSRSEFRQASELWEKAKQIGYGEEAFAVLTDIISKYVLDWRNFDRPFSVEAVGEVLTNDEYAELAEDCKWASALARADLKNSLPPAESKAAESVNTALPASV